MMQKVSGNFSPFIGLPVMAMGLVVLLSNILVRYPINDWLTWAAFSYPVCFFINDLTNRFYGAGHARKTVYAGFMVGVLLSFIVADIRIAVASGTAFLLAQLLDVSVFNILRKKAWWQAPLISTLLASFIDSLLFFSIAFGGTEEPWLTWGIGDFGVKVFMGLLLLPLFGWLTARKMTPA